MSQNEWSSTQEQQEHQEKVVVSRSAGKKRSWTLRRRVALATVLIGFALAGRWVQANAMPHGLSVPRPAEMPKAQGANAAHFYAAAADAIQETKSNLDPNTVSLDLQREAVAKNGETLALLRQGFPYQYQGAVTGWQKNLPAEGLSNPVPSFISQRTLARLLIADARIKASAGDKAAAMEASLDALRFGTDIGGRGDTMLGAMIGTLVEKMGTQEALRYVNGLNAEEARAATRRLEGLMQNQAPFSRMLEAERRFGTAALGELFDTSRRHSFKLLGIEEDGVPIGLGYDATILWWGKQGVYDNYTRRMDEMIRRANLPYQQAKGMGEVPKTNDPITRIIVPDLDRALRARTQAQTRARVLQAQLAVQAYRAEHGGVVPQSLEALTTGSDPYLAAVPVDQFSPDGTAPLHYKDGRIWSVGENGKDDNGAGDDDAKDW